jgi:hypothetical protein
MRTIGLMTLQICLILSIYSLTLSYGHFMGSLPTPCPTAENPVLKNIKENLVFLGAPKKTFEDEVKAIYAGFITTNMPHELITAIVHTESTHNPKAMGVVAYDGNRYGGLMGTDHPSGYSDVDILKGIRKFYDKLKSTNGNVPTALALYKGGNNPLARKEAAEVMRHRSYGKHS